jgi:predicted TIM-barrel fold metal-dependent hydrolase
VPADDARSLPPPLQGRRVIDVHVHAFPPRVTAAIHRWFDAHAWSIAYRMEAVDGLRYLLERGIDRVVGLCYSHVPGMAEALNQFMAELALVEPRLIPFGTVLPGEDGARAILDRALGAQKLRGIKIHCHVQCVAPDEARMDDVYDAAAAHGVPVLIHAGDSPPNQAYRCDPRALCSTDHIAAALTRHPRTTVIVPHLGASRIDEVSALLARHENLYLDTTMALAGYPIDEDLERLRERAEAAVRAYPERILYGSDFPNLPYAWDRELCRIAELGLDSPALDLILGGNAARLLGV